jgi:hypothetical protein
LFATSVPAGIDASLLIRAATPLFVKAQAQDSLTQLSKAIKAFLSSIPTGMHVSSLASATIPVESSLRSSLALLTQSNLGIVESVAAKVNTQSLLADIASNFDFPRLFTPGLRNDAVVDAVSSTFMLDFLKGFGGTIDASSGNATRSKIGVDGSRIESSEAATLKSADKDIEAAVEIVGLLLLAFCVLYPSMAAVCLSGVETIVATGVSIVDAIGTLFQHSDFLTGLAAIGFIGGTGAYVHRKTSKGSDAESRDEEAEK